MRTGHPSRIESGTGFRLKTLCFERLVTAPARQKSAPAAGLGLGWADLFREFVCRAVLVDSGVVGRPYDGNHGGNRRRGGLRNILAGPEQRGRPDGARFGGWR